jgi:hypothetical protein
MARTRARATGRRGGEAEQFAYIPLDVMQAPALASAGHAAFRILAILVAGKSRERNGTLMCSETYAARFGMDSKGTVSQALTQLEERGIIERTRRVAKFSKHATLWAVTWWPIHYRDGQPLAAPEPASHRYAQWQPITPHTGVKVSGRALKRSPRKSGEHTPVVGVESAIHHPDLGPFRANHHPDSRGHSKNLGGGAPSRTAGIEARVRKLMHLQPHLSDAEVAHTFRASGIDALTVQSLRQSLSSNSEAVA